MTKPGDCKSQHQNQMAQQIDINLRLAFEADLQAPVPEHLQRLIEALQKKLPPSSR
ncbi:hypothetical protein [Pseudotabrizicola formosa]|uniref:hypothetical protein n=1 Tax=Pseudotabrizicola formosa TaxID=2030009 RepID=UPI00143D815C|nr:hypothetical protein [Pseudotabrizicola formosa]